MLGGAIKANFHFTRYKLQEDHSKNISKQLSSKYLQWNQVLNVYFFLILSKKISNDQELIQSDPISCPQNQKGNN